MTIRSHYNVKEMVVEGLDHFNNRLKQLNRDF